MSNGDLLTSLLIGGEWRASSDGQRFETVNPATEEVLAEIDAASEADVDEAVRAARSQLEGGAWSRMSGPERGALLARFADLIERDAERLAHLEAIDVGKPIAEPRAADIPMAVATFRYFAGWADKIEGRTIPTPGAFGRPTLSYTIREPSGVLGAIVPWNAPTMITAWKLAPALACGCTAVVKPAQDATLSVLHLASLAQEAGFPPGTLNVVPGRGRVAGHALAAHPGVDKVSFTGSPEVGREVARAAADHFADVTLELGGKSPQIVFADADIERAVAGLAEGLFRNQGEICAAGTRILVQRGVREEVVNGLVEAARQIVLGDPLEPGTTMGALINGGQLEQVLRYIELGKAEGANLAAGGSRPERRGFFVEPTVFTDASNQMRIARDEIFGPVGTVISFDDEEEAVATANDTRYGLTATVWTRDLSLAHGTAKQLRAGSVWINAWSPIDPRLPWGGMKESGIGRELGSTALRANSEEKTVTVVL